MAEERLQRALARAGFGSRRSCEDLISAGRVKVNGRLATLGDEKLCDLKLPRGDISPTGRHCPTKPLRALVRPFAFRVFCDLH